MSLGNGNRSEFTSLTEGSRNALVMQSGFRGGFISLHSTPILDVALVVICLSAALTEN
jgi:hypothetical protein